MKFRLEITVDPRTPDGWDTPADAEDTLNALVGEIEGLDYETSGTAFFVTDVDAEIIQA